MLLIIIYEPKLSASPGSWNFQSLLPYFKRTETHFDPKANDAVHGKIGMIHNASVSSSGRQYPLKELLRFA